MDKLPENLYAGNWKIIAGIPCKEKDKYIVLGHNPKSFTPYGTWVCFTDYEAQTYAAMWGNYFEEKESALEDMLKRAKIK